MYLNTGIDLVEINRMKTAVEKWGERLLKRVFTEREINYSRKKACFYTHLAARFAAKEAVIKSLGKRDIDFKNIEVVNNDFGKPEIRLNQPKWENRKKIALSISHTKDYAIAQVITY